MSTKPSQVKGLESRLPGFSTSGTFIDSLFMSWGVRNEFLRWFKWLIHGNFKLLKHIKLSKSKLTGQGRFLEYFSNSRILRRQLVSNIARNGIPMAKFFFSKSGPWHPKNGTKWKFLKKSFRKCAPKFQYQVRNSWVTDLKKNYDRHF